ncbi:MAG: ATP-binding protein [Candidatus Izemoplasmatales bacterium]|jgi:tRNA(Ile)-lysidine synthase TilS/MesJ|nr:ATP-binding protein [Candidatus Izemoplasmatales bacterium]
MKKNNYSEYISKSLNKTFKSVLFGRFLRAIDDYKLIEDNDKICVALSGGKDSLLLAALFEEYKIHYNNNIQVVYLMMNSGFTEKFYNDHLENIKKLGIEQVTKESKVYEIANQMNPKSPCFLCARMRRGFLYQAAKDLGCNKLALGHHFDDVIETTLMNMFYTGTFKTMLPKAKSQNYENIELIRPMYLIKEKDVQRFIKYHDFTINPKGCLFQERNTDSKRQEVKTLVNELRKIYKNIDINIFRSAENINLSSVLGYYEDGEDKVSFLDKY